MTLAPGTRISGCKALKGRAAKRVNRAGQALRLTSSTVRHDNSFIGACHRARLRRLGAPRSIKAAVHQLARLICAMLTRGKESRKASNTSRPNAATGNYATLRVRPGASILH